jgi:radical SAM enzyme (TIGR01210 family)
LEKEITSKVIREFRPGKASVKITEPYMFLHEREMQESGNIEPVNTIFLTNKECPFTCLMCDLWKHTLDEPTPQGAIPAQIEYALSRLPEAKVVKLYNSGNFFDGKAIPQSDYQPIADLLSDYDHVIVENHPRLIGPSVDKFQSLLNGTLEIAMGLETIHPQVLPALNKNFSISDFKLAASFFREREIDMRVFLLLNPPFLTDEKANQSWCLKSVEFAFEEGVKACTIIPTREGNGIMQQLKESGDYVPPALKALERVFTKALSLGKGRVFCDTWDLKLFSDCERCFNDRKKRLDDMNLQQEPLPEIVCDCQ